MNVPTSVQQLEPFPGHSAFGLTATDQSTHGSITYNAGKTLEELLQEAGIDKYTNDFFMGLVHLGMRERAILTFFREMNGQSSAWQNQALADAFDGQQFYEARDEKWEGDNRWYPLSPALDQDRRLDQMRAFQCAAALRGYANDPPIPEDQPPCFPNIKKRDTQGIQYLFLNWLCIECMKWSPTLGDVILHQKVWDRVRTALRSPQWIAAVANQVAHIEYHDYKDELLGLVIKLLVLNWPEIKEGKVNLQSLVNDVLDVDKAIYPDKVVGSVGKLFDTVLGDRWDKGIEAFAERERAKGKKFSNEFRPKYNDEVHWNIYYHKLWDYTGTKADMSHPARFDASNLITEDMQNESVSNLLKLLY